MLTGDVRVAVSSQDTHIAAARRYHHGSFAGNGDVHIRRDPMIARTLRIGIETHRLTTDVDLRLCAQIPFVGVFLLVGTDAFVDYHPYLVFIGGSHIHRAAIVDHV